MWEKKGRGEWEREGREGRGGEVGGKEGEGCGREVGVRRKVVWKGKKNREWGV